MTIDIQELDQTLKAIEKENRLLKKKLDRSEFSRANLEIANQQREKMLHSVIKEY